MNSKRILVVFLALCLVVVVKAQYDSHSYVWGVQQRANQTFNNGVANIQQMMRNQMQNNQYTIERLRQAFIGALNYATNCEQQNGYTPSEYEKDCWVAKNYPDVYNLYIQGKYNGNAPSGPQKCWTCNGTGDCECVRAGHSGKTGTMSTDRNGNQIFIKHQACNGNGKCPACKGRGVR